jgi:hypothetical protein
VKGVLLEIQTTTKTFLVDPLKTLPVMVGSEASEFTVLDWSQNRYPAN